MDPSFAVAHYRLGELYEEEKMYDKALSEFKQIIKLSDRNPLGPAALARVYALAGKRDESQKYLEQLLQMSKQRYVSPGLIALVYVALGDKDKTFAWLEELDKAHDLNAVRLKTDPRYDSLRSDSRF